MGSVSTLIDFLMRLMGDDDTKAEFERDPRDTLARNDLDGVTGQDVRDARLIMADNGSVSPRSGEASLARSTDNDPVREIRHTTNNYEIDSGHHLSVGHVEQTFNLVNIDDHDTVVVDSFNSNNNNDVDSVAIQDNDTIENTDIDIEDSFNKEENPADVDPVEPEPEAEPVDVPFDEEPVVGVDPVDEEPDLDPVAEAAVI